MALTFCLVDHKLGDTVTETLLWKRQFPSLAAEETLVEEATFARWKQENVFGPSPKHFFASQMQALLFPSLGAEETMG